MNSELRSIRALKKQIRDLQELLIKLSDILQEIEYEAINEYYKKY